MNIITVIPARGGSKGIPKKNVRLLMDQPLISYSINNSKRSKFNMGVVVTTDDDEIERISKKYGADIVNRPNELSDDHTTLDPVVNHAVEQSEKKHNITYDIVITMQPTSPLLSTRTLDDAVDYFIDSQKDTVISGINDPHLSWTEIEGELVENYVERLNRQYLPKHLKETGAFVITKRDFVKEDNRLGEDLTVYEVPEKESIDIDTPQDWWVAEKELSKKKILIRTDGYKDIGLGHIYRTLLLAYNLIDHEVKFVISNHSDTGIDKVKESFFPYEVINDNNELINIIEKENADIVINDILDTSSEYIKLIKDTGVRVVNFEDLGDGTQYADAVINDLYAPQNDLNNHYWGSDFYCLRDEFLLSEPTPLRNQVRNILVIFGGTDPSNLTEKVLDAINLMPDSKELHFEFILGLGYRHFDEFKEKVEQSETNITIRRDVKHMSDAMSEADLAISSQGRTMLELASMAVPTILMGQNSRELYHEFGYLENGFINLGLGTEVREDTIKETLTWLINSPQIRKQMKDQMLKKDLKKGLRRVLNIILNYDCR